MDVKIKIYKKVRAVVDGRGKDTGELYYNPWATPLDLYNNEVYEALNVQLENVAIFEVKWCKKIEALRQHKKDYYIEFNGEKYEIYAANFKANSKTKVVIKANRID